MSPSWKGLNMYFIKIIALYIKRNNWHSGSNDTTMKRIQSFEKGIIFLIGLFSFVVFYSVGVFLSLSVFEVFVFVFCKVDVSFTLTFQTLQNFCEIVLRSIPAASENWRSFTFHPTLGTLPYGFVEDLRYLFHLEGRIYPELWRLYYLTPDLNIRHAGCSWWEGRDRRNNSAF